MFDFLRVKLIEIARVIYIFFFLENVLKNMDGGCHNSGLCTDQKEKVKLSVWM